jgi:regulator of replication initiation timing
MSMTQKSRVLDLHRVKATVAGPFLFAAFAIVLSACDKGASNGTTSGGGSASSSANTDQPAALKAVDDSIAKLLARVDSSTVELRVTVETQEKAIEGLRQANPSALQQLSSVVEQFIKMKASLKAKDDTIAQLRNRIKSLVAENGRLRGQIAKLTGNVASRDSLLTRSDSVMKSVDVRLMATEATRDSIRRVVNTGRILVAERGELERLGLAGKTNRFGLGRVVLENVDPSLMRPVEIATDLAFEIPASASKVTLLTAHPDDSYVIAPNGGGSTLRIKNPDAFWASSKVAVVMFRK